jgi:hypothetical protein
MSLKVIGTGFGRTGTLSLKYALEKLGYEKCYHMSEILKFKHNHLDIWTSALDGEMVDWDELYEGYQASVDYPGCLFYKELLHQYPDAKVILTQRDPEGWYDSTYKTLFSANVHRSHSKGLFHFFARKGRSRQTPEFTEKFNILQKKLIWDGIFSGQFSNKDLAIGVYLNHIDEVKQFVPSDKLLEFDLREGWDPLCQFLNKPVPTGNPFPHVNTRARFRKGRFTKE